MTKKTTPQKPLVHFVAPYLLNPVHRISVTLIGVGGNGCQMLSSLARIDHALRALGHPGLKVTAYDGDTVTEPNIGRQLFSESELGLNKAQAFITRINRFFGLDWEARPEMFKKGVLRENIIISCVDGVKTRLDIAAAFQKCRRDKNSEEYKTYYWLDLGNGQRIGQAVLGSAVISQPKSDKYQTCNCLPLVTEEFDLASVNDEDSGPSCSMAEALNKQDLFINSVLVQMAGSLLWSLLRDCIIDTRGFFVNLESFKTTGMPIRNLTAKERKMFENV